MSDSDADYGSGVGHGMRSQEEIEEALEVCREDPTSPDRVSNAERRRTLLWVLGRDSEAEEIEYEDGSLPHVFR